jgi:hypothetical protein
MRVREANSVEQRGGIDASVPILGKPYGKQKVAQKIREALDGPPHEAAIELKGWRSEPAPMHRGPADHSYRSATIGSRCEAR